jgi:5-methylcytosine-specific restriction endonuclease McrA
VALMLRTGQGGTSAWRRRRLVILDRDGWTCQLRLRCLGARATHVDHIVAMVDWPPGQPGVDEPSNLQASCAECNLAKGRAPALRSWKW